MNMTTFNGRLELFFSKMRSCENLISLDFRNWLIGQGFFTQAASTKFHGNFEGGLFLHSLAVTDALLSFTYGLDLEWTRPESPYIIGMFHDLCKIDNYITVVDDEGVQYFGSDDVKGREVHFEYNDDCILKGHAEKSIILLSQFMTLTEEEILCIRFHMGAYERDDWEGFDKAIKKYPNVLFTHTADMLVSKTMV